MGAIFRRAISDRNHSRASHPSRVERQGNQRPRPRTTTRTGTIGEGRKQVNKRQNNVAGSTQSRHWDSVYGSWDRNGPTSEITGLITSNSLSRKNFLHSIRKESSATIEKYI